MHSNLLTRFSLVVYSSILLYFSHCLLYILECRIEATSQAVNYTQEKEAKKIEEIWQLRISLMHGSFTFFSPSINSSRLRLQLSYLLLCSRALYKARVIYSPKSSSSPFPCEKWEEKAEIRGSWPLSWQTRKNCDTIWRVSRYTSCLRAGNSMITNERVHSTFRKSYRVEFISWKFIRL